MKKQRSSAILAGVLLILAIVVGVLLVVLSEPLLEPENRFARIMAKENLFLLCALLQFIMAGACAGIALVLYPIIRKSHPILAIGSVGFRLMEAILFTVGTAALLMVLTLGRMGEGDAALTGILGELALAFRGWLSSVLGAVAFCLGAMMYYAAFFLSQHLPRWLSAWGFIAAALHLLSALLVMFGMEPFSAPTLILNLPIFLNELVLASWLIIKGFNPASADQTT
jgi:hypothetical protein